MKKPVFPRGPKSAAQAILEFALVLPILLLVIYGLLEVGRMLFIYNSVVSAARQAARYGAVTGLDVSGGVPRYQDCEGIRSAAQRLGFLNRFENADIRIWHDDGEGSNQVAYCAPSMVSDTSFRPSIGNSSRVRVQVSAQYAPILSLTPLQPLTISSISARTILVSVPVSITAGPQYFYGEAAATPTSQGALPTKTAAPTRISPAAAAATSAAVCDVRHSLLGTWPFGMIISNYSAAVTIHIAQIQIWNPPSPPGQTLNSLTLGGARIWNGASQIESPILFSDFSGDISITPRANKFLQVVFSRNYKANGSEKIIVVFAESECPVLDSSDPSQLP
jgi:hypothetical protein